MAKGNLEVAIREARAREVSTVTAKTAETVPTVDPPTMSANTYTGSSLALPVSGSRYPEGSTADTITIVTMT